MIGCNQENMHAVGGIAHPKQLRRIQILLIYQPAQSRLSLDELWTLSGQLVVV
jgi:hypothetical protein